MTHIEDLREAELRSFRTAYDDGLWDVLVACFVAMFAVAPLLSSSLGDFWSAAIFVPVWLGAYGLIWLIRRTVVSPRVGVVRLGVSRQRRLRTMTVLLLTLNAIAFIGGLIAAVQGPAAGWTTTIVFWLIVLALFSVMGYFLDTPRLYAYGLMLGAAVVIGEWLFREGYVAHHGYPVMFGLATIAIATVGLVRFVRLIGRTQRSTPENGAASDAR